MEMREGKGIGETLIIGRVISEEGSRGLSFADLFDICRCFHGIRRSRGGLFLIPLGIDHSEKLPVL